jgi:hypothetical protein
MPVREQLSKRSISRVFTLVLLKQVDHLGEALKQDARDVRLARCQTPAGDSETCSSNCTVTTNCKMTRVSHADVLAT